ncbi:hypothetical protein [Dickeya undicola]|uniref:Uncharacterized protein n=1 Tax=Dickeya undicola TaxID=1577887 RepID=A0A3N0FQL9_9GAMM|nr:hypothetical protein [Dickeya undicola]RNM02385.1 hypothetical protein EF878_20155 [Dickeya undicola]
MKHRYLTETEKPGFDDIISNWLAQQDDEIDGIPYKIALYHDGYLYRSITCSGLGEYVRASRFLESQGFVNALKAEATYRGYDALFATLDEYKKAFPTT